MKFFALIDKNKEVHLAEDRKVIPKDEFTTFLDATQLIEEIKAGEIEFRKRLELEAEQVRQKSEEEGFQSGLEKWSEQLIALEDVFKKKQDEVTASLVPLTMTAIKKLIGKELSVKPDTIVDIVTTALRPVSNHKNISIYVSKHDLDILEEKRPQIREIFEYLESLSISAREDITEGGCIIETESGIINAQLDSQLDALEGAFRTFFQNKDNA